MITIEQYLHYFSEKETIEFSASHEVFTIIKENGEPFAYFNENSIIFKLYDGVSFYALKCFTDYKNSNDKIVYDQDHLAENNLETTIVCQKDLQINISNSFENTTALHTNWIDDVLFLNCNHRYKKELYNNENNALYKKRRTKIKAGVLTTLTILLICVSGIKYMQPNAIFINPIDYRQLIVDDSLRTVEIAMNKNKIPVTKSEIKIITKTIDIQTIADIVSDDKTFINKAAETKKNIEYAIAKNKKAKLEAASKKLKTDTKVAKEKEKEKKSKSNVTFKSTEF